PESFPEIDTWAVPVKKVLNLDGSFKVEDNKRHLGLPDDRKLILVNSADDRYMKMLWRHGDELDFRGHNFDYWTPPFFSIYKGESKFLNLFNAFRKQIFSSDTGSQFVWFFRYKWFPRSLFDPIKKATSVLISGQHSLSPRQRRLFRSEIDTADLFFPNNARFFLLADAGWKRFPAGRRVYVINSRWINQAIRGYDVALKKRKELSTEQLLINNLQEALDEQTARCKGRS
ncbi:MAG TPA: hypothetical protein VMX35_06755, partial [Acidobacteriota bacterium]|nr:hypothetical protein [Acidobacteriota bacterium]